MLKYGQMSAECDRAQALDLPPRERLVFACNVNRICRLGAEDFYPPEHLPMIQEIIRVLDPKLYEVDPEGNTFIADLDDFKPKSQFVGQTSHGQYNHFVEEQRRRPGLRKEQEEAIGIGEYIVSKQRSGDHLKFVFDHFFDYSTLGHDGELSRIPSVSIDYRQDKQEVIEINQLVAKEYRLFRFRYNTQKAYRIWPLQKMIE